MVGKTALRDHWDNMTEGSVWFGALLKFRVEARETILGEHFATTAQNPTYTSSVIQNEMIGVLGDQIRHQIITKVQAT